MGYFEDGWLAGHIGLVLLEGQHRNLVALKNEDHDDLGSKKNFFRCYTPFRIHWKFSRQRRFGSSYNNFVVHSIQEIMLSLQMLSHFMIKPV